MSHSFDETGVSQRPRARKLVMGIAIVMVVVVSLAVLSPSFLPDSNDHIDTHKLDIWAEPRDFEYDIRCIFYESRQDAETDANRLIYAGVIVTAGTDETTMYLQDIPVSLTSVWASIHCRYEPGIATDAAILELVLGITEDVTTGDFEMTVRLTLV
ncbi:MAG: hypothetical protein ACFFD6_10485 [Candidatus Thorarchaeota archaeon]